MICDSKVFIHKRFGETCRFIIDLKKCQLESVQVSTSLRFSLKLESFPAFEFDVLDVTEALCWKLSFYTAWKNIREGEFNFQYLIDSMKKMKKEKDSDTSVPADDDFSVDSSVRSLGSVGTQRSMCSEKSLISLGSISSTRLGGNVSGRNKTRRTKKTIEMIL